MELNAAQASAPTRSLRRKALSACAAGVTALGLTLGAAAVPAQADVYEGLDEEVLNQLIAQFLEELESAGELEDVFGTAPGADGGELEEQEDDQETGFGLGSDSEDDEQDEGDQDEQNRFGADRDSETDEGYTWDVEEPLAGEELAELLVKADELPESWEVDQQFVDEDYAEAADVSDLEVTQDGVMIGGPNSDGYLNKDFSLTGFDVSAECDRAVRDFDAIEEPTEYLVILPVSVDGAFAMVALASTAEEHDLYTGYYSDIVEECGTAISQGPVDVAIEPYETFDGFSVEFSDGFSAEQVHIGGASFGHNHVFFVGEGDLDPEEIQEVVQAQIDALDEAVN